MVSGLFTVQIAASDSQGIDQVSLSRDEGFLDTDSDPPLAAKVSGDTGLSETARGDLEEVARLLLDQALIMEGESPPDPTAFARRLSRLVAQGLAAD